MKPPASPFKEEFEKVKLGHTELSNVLHFKYLSAMQSGDGDPSVKDALENYRTYCRRRSSRIDGGHNACKGLAVELARLYSLPGVSPDNTASISKLRHANP